MCLLFVYINNNPDENGYRLILASNRDEFWQRPTGLVDFRDNNKWVGGVDLEPGKEGGSWLGISTDGKVAVLLNILSPQKLDARGRGSLVRDYLTQNKTSGDYIQEVSESASLYNPFHLITFNIGNDCDVDCVTFCGETQTRKFPKGYHGADNGKDIQKPWRKREEGEAIFSRLVESFGTADKKDRLIDGIIDLLNDKTQYFPDERLKEQFREVGRPDHGPQILSRSSMFVFSPEWSYGTRTNSVILVDKGGNCDFVERTLQTPVDTNNLQWETKKLQFKVTLQQSCL